MFNSLDSRSEIRKYLRIGFFLFPIIFLIVPGNRSWAKSSNAVSVPVNSGVGFASLLQEGIAEINDVAVISGLAIKESLYLVADDLYLRYRVALEKEGVGLNPLVDGNYRSGIRIDSRSLTKYPRDFSENKIGQNKILDTISRFHSALVMMTNFYNHPIIQSRMTDGLAVLSIGSVNASRDVSNKIGYFSDNVYAGYRAIDPNEAGMAFIKSFFIFQRP